MPLLRSSRSCWLLIASLALLAFSRMDASASGIAAGTDHTCALATSSRFLIDGDMIDVDVPAIEDLADQLGIDNEDLVSDSDDDGYIDLPPGSQLDLPTGEVAYGPQSSLENPRIPL